MWWTIAALAQTPLEWPVAPRPRGNEPEVCALHGRVDRNAAHGRAEYRGCTDAARAALGAEVAGWSWKARDPGPVGIFSRSPGNGDPPVPAQLPPRKGMYLEVQRKVVPDSPGNRGPGPCFGRTHIDRNGVPFLVLVTGCDPDLFAAAADALLQWRWLPPQDEAGTPQLAQTTIVVSFVTD